MLILNNNNKKKTLKAWIVHALTSSGVILAFLALIYLMENKPQICLLLLGIALLIDGLDGTLARKYKVKIILPYFDGSRLDLVIDYITYVFIPSFFFYKYIPVPKNFELLTSSIILLSSLFYFCHINMKSKDHYFIGFPTSWNIVVACLYILDLYPWINLFTVVLLVILTLTNMKFIHPFRVNHLMTLNIIATFIWLISSAFLIINTTYVNKIFLYVLWGIASIYFIIICIWRSAKEFFN